MAFQADSPLSSLSFSSLYSTEQVRELDRRAIEEHGIPGIVLMKRAGQAILDEILKWNQESARDLSYITIFCGSGNNGGDGYIVAGLAKQKNIDVCLVETAGEKLTGDAKRAREFAIGQSVEAFSAEEWIGNPELTENSIIVDALLGTGFNGELRRLYVDLITCINQSGRPVFAADIPSGLYADTGTLAEHAVNADVTVTFIGMKVGLFTGQGRNYSGDIVFDDLQVPSEVYEGVEPMATMLDYDTLADLMPLREEANHKGHHGHLVIVGGDHSFGGAPLMTALAAARAGAGLVSVVTRAEHRAAIIARHPEVMVCNADDTLGIQNFLQKADAIVVGPGLGVNAWGQKLLQTVLQADKPMVVDADALNILASGRMQSRLPLGASVITPHPGEASRLLQVSTREVNQNRIAAVDALQKKFAAVALLKGSGSLISDGSHIALCPYGNPGMGTGGMGDVLSGIIGSLMVQGLKPPVAAKIAASVHAYAADRVSEEQGQIGLMATDIIDEARRLINGF